MHYNLKITLLLSKIQSKAEVTSMAMEKCLKCLLEPVEKSVYDYKYHFKTGPNYSNKSRRNTKTQHAAEDTTNQVDTKLNTCGLMRVRIMFLSCNRISGRTIG